MAPSRNPATIASRIPADRRGSRLPTTATVTPACRPTAGVHAVARGASSLRTQKIRRSSAAALGSFYEAEAVGEDYPLRPNNTYSASKAAMEMVLRGLWNRIPLDLCSLRFTVIYGPGRETTFTDEDGTSWVQTDSQRIYGLPDTPFDAELKRGAMGSYFLVPAERARAIRVRPVNR